MSLILPTAGARKVLDIAQHCSDTLTVSIRLPGGRSAVVYCGFRVDVEQYSGNRYESYPSLECFKEAYQLID